MEKKPKIKTGCFPLKETFFLWRLRFSVSILYHLGCIFGRNSAFIFVFVKISGGLCKTKKLLPSVSSGKKGLEVLKSTFVTFGTFSLLDWLRFFFWFKLFFFGGDVRNGRGRQEWQGMPRNGRGCHESSGISGMASDARNGRGCQEWPGMPGMASDARHATFTGNVRGYQE